MKKGCAGVLALLLFAVLGFVAWKQFFSPRVSSVPLAQLPASEQARRREDARGLEAQVRDIERSARAGEKKRFDLEVSDEQLNTLLQDRIDLSKFPVRGLRVAFEPERVVAQGEVKFNGIQATATLAGVVSLEDGALKYTSESLQVGGIPAPSDWKKKLDKNISEQLNRALEQAPGRVDAVRLEQGKMVVSGQTD